MPGHRHGSYDGCMCYACVSGRIARGEGDERDRDRQTEMKAKTAARRAARAGIPNV